jgi:hypothetical protein
VNDDDEVSEEVYEEVSEVPWFLKHGFWGAIAIFTVAYLGIMAAIKIVAVITGTIFYVIMKILGII